MDNAYLARLIEQPDPSACVGLRWTSLAHTDNFGKELTPQTQAVSADITAQDKLILTRWKPF